MAKNFDLTEEEFVLLRDQLLEGNELLFEQIFLSHFEDCRSFLCRKYKCSQEDAYDATMETMLVFRQKIIEDKIDYNNLRFLFTRMAGQYLIKDLEKQKKQKSAFSRDVVEEHNEEDIDMLSKSWDKLGEGCQQLLKSFYYFDMPLKDIADLKSQNYAALRKQKERCVTKLRSLFMQYSTNENG